MAEDYSGPFRHIHIELREREGGYLAMVHEYEVHRGKRRHIRFWRTISIPAVSRPPSAAGMLYQVARLLERHAR